MIQKLREIGQSSRYAAQVIKAMSEHDYLTQSMCAQVTGLSIQTCRKWLDVLVESRHLDVHPQLYRNHISVRVYTKLLKDD